MSFELRHPYKATIENTEGQPMRRHEGPLTRPAPISRVDSERSSGLT